MALESYFVEPCKLSVVSALIEKWHYSKSVNGIKIYQCFALWKMDTEAMQYHTLVGGMIYGAPAMNNQASSWNPSNPSKCIELRRLACIDDTPKNAESFFVGHSLRWLRKNTDIEVVLSYADPAYGHEGGIYKAANFERVGMTAEGKVLMVDGKKYHDRTLRNPKPYARRIKERFNNNDANVYLQDTPSKIIYLYRLQ